MIAWTPLEVVLIVLVFFPLALPIIFSPYLLTILSIMALASGSFAMVQGATPRGVWLWFSLLTGLFTLVLVAGAAALLAFSL